MFVFHPQIQKNLSWLVFLSSHWKVILGKFIFRHRLSFWDQCPYLDRSLQRYCLIEIRKTLVADGPICCHGDKSLISCYLLWGNDTALMLGFWWDGRRYCPKNCNKRRVKAKHEGLTNCSPTATTSSFLMQALAEIWVSQELRSRKILSYYPIINSVFEKLHLCDGFFSEAALIQRHPLCQEKMAVTSLWYKLPGWNNKLDSTGIHGDEMALHLTSGFWLPAKVLQPPLIFLEELKGERRCAMHAAVALSTHCVGTREWLRLQDTPGRNIPPDPGLQDHESYKNLNAVWEGQLCLKRATLYYSMQATLCATKLHFF